MQLTVKKDLPFLQGTLDSCFINWLHIWGKCRKEKDFLLFWENINAKQECDSC